MDSPIPSKTNIEYLLLFVFDNCILYLLLVVTIAHADEIYYFVESPWKIKVALQVVVVTVASCRHDPLQEINEALKSFCVWASSSDRRTGRRDLLCFKMQYYEKVCGSSDQRESRWDFLLWPKVRLQVNCCKWWVAKKVPTVTEVWRRSLSEWF